MKISDPIFTWNKDEGVATCTIYAKSFSVTAVARCHPDDKDFCTEATGCEIAYVRAVIKIMKKIKRTEIEIPLKTLVNFYNSIKHSKSFNSQSYGNKKLQKNIHQLQYELDIIEDLLAEQEEKLNDYLQRKENFYQRVRSYRRVQVEENKHKDENK